MDLEVLSYHQFSSVTQSRPTLCNPMNCSMPGLPVHHRLPGFTQTYIHWVRDAIQQCHPRSSPSPPAPIPPSIRVFSNESTLRMRWPKDWSFSLSIIPSEVIPGLISSRMDWLDLLAVQGTLKSLLQHHSSKASILWHSAFFRVQLWHPYMTTGKTIALTRRTLVSKVISLLLNMLSRLVITFLPRSKWLLISWLQSLSAVILELPKINSDTISIGRKATTNLDSILKSRDITSLTKVHIVKAVVFPIVIYGCESWTIKKAECWRIDAFKLWCWRRLLRVPWSARRPNQPILKVISPAISLEGMMLKLKTPVLWPPHAKSWLIGEDSDGGRDWGQEEKGTTEDQMAGWHQRLDGRESEWTPGVGDGQGGLVCCDSWGHRVGHAWATELNWTELRVRRGNGGVREWQLKGFFLWC